MCIASSKLLCFVGMIFLSWQNRCWHPLSFLCWPYGWRKKAPPSDIMLLANGIHFNHALQSSRGYQCHTLHSGEGVADHVGQYGSITCPDHKHVLNILAHYLLHSFPALRRCPIDIHAIIQAQISNVQRWHYKVVDFWSPYDATTLWHLSKWENTNIDKTRASLLLQTCCPVLVTSASFFPKWNHINFEPIHVKVYNMSLLPMECICILVISIIISINIVKARLLYWTFVFNCSPDWNKVEFHWWLCW